MKSKINGENGSLFVLKYAKSCLVLNAQNLYLFHYLAIEHIQLNSEFSPFSSEPAQIARYSPEFSEMLMQKSIQCTKHSIH